MQWRQTAASFVTLHTVTVHSISSGGRPGVPHLDHGLQFVGVGVRALCGAHRVGSRYFKSSAIRIKSESRLRLRDEPIAYWLSGDKVKRRDEKARNPSCVGAGGEGGLTGLGPGGAQCVRPAASSSGTGRHRLRTAGLVGFKMHPLPPPPPPPPAPPAPPAHSHCSPQASTPRQRRDKGAAG